MANSANERLAQLTNAIIKRTKDRTLSWERTSVEGVFGTTIGEYVVHLYEKFRQGSSAPDYYIELFDRTGERVENFNDMDLSDYPAQGYDGFFNAMGDLYAIVRQQASGANEAIDAILRALGE